MDYIGAFLFQFFLLFFTISLLWILKRKPQKETQETKELRQIGTIGMIRLICMAFAKTGVIEGRKESRFQKVYDAFMSSSSIYAQKPFLWKILGKTIGLAVFDSDAIIELQKSDAFNDRAPDYMLVDYGRGKPRGIVLNNGKEWNEIKRYTKKKFVQLGLGRKGTMASLLEDQLPELLNSIGEQKKNTDNKIQVHGLFSVSVLNIILLLLGGKKFSKDDPQFIGIFESVLAITNFHLFQLAGLLSFSKVWGIREFFGYSGMMKTRDNYIKLLGDYIDDRESLGMYKGNPEVFLDFFLHEIEKNKEDERLNEVYDKNQLVTLVQDLLIAGMDSTSKFLESFLMFMCLYPEVQLKVHNEIDLVMGTSSQPHFYENKLRMPYTLAVMAEVHRLANIIPIIPRYTTKDTRIGDQNIKKGTFVMSFMFALRFDDKFWKDPNVFRPERFLDHDGNIMQETVDRMLLFGYGGRVCPAEYSAPAVSFTYAVGFLQKYNVKKACDSEVFGFRDDFGAVNGPDPFHISIFER